MGDNFALTRLMSWLSPAFPTGSFAYSAGLETAIAQGAVTNAGDTRDWIAANLAHGNARTDSILIAHAHRCHNDVIGLSGLAELAFALSTAAERSDEMTAMGQAFKRAASAWPQSETVPLPNPSPYPVTVGAISGAHGLPCLDVLTACLLANAQAQVSVAVRLVPIGQREGVKILAGLEKAIADAAGHAVQASLSDLGTIGYAADIAAMAHETLQTRLFRS